MANQLELMMEADRRGILPPDKKVLLDEAKRRGLIPGVEAPVSEAPQASATPPVQDTPAPVAEAPKPSGINPVSGAIDQALQGATFGFSDELIGGARAAMESGVNLVRGQDANFGENYTKARDYERQRLKDFEAEHPVVATASNIAGGLAGAAPAAAAVKGAGLLGGIARGAGIGAGYGALGGIGAGEGGVEDHINSALSGAVIGGGVGAALPVAGAVAGKAAELGRNLIGRNNPRDVALDTLNRGLQRDQVTPEQVMERLNSTEKPMSIMDVAGDNMYRQARLAETTPGPGSNLVKDFLHERQFGQVDRAAQDVEKKIGKGDNFYLSLDELNSVRKEAAAPLYEKAYSKPFVWNDKIETLLNRPATRKAMGRAYNIAEEEGRDPRGLGLNLDSDGNVKIDKTAASMQTLDYVKRGLDDVLESHRDAVTGKLKADEGVRAIVGTHKEFVKTIDNLNPDYAEARKAWGGPSETMEAMWLGRKFAKGDPEAVIDRFRKMSDGNKDAFRIGVARELAGNLQSTRDGANSINRIFGSQGQRNRLRPIFDSEDEFKAFQTAMDEEQRMSRTRNEVLANSKTLRNTVDANDASGLMGQAMMDATTGGLTGMAMGIARRALNKASIGMSEKPAAELASMIATSDRKTQEKIVQELVRRQQQVETKANRANARVAVPSAAAANLMSQQQAQDDNRYRR